MELQKRIIVRIPEKDQVRLKQEAMDAKLGFSAYIRTLLGIKA